MFPKKNSLWHRVSSWWSEWHAVPNRVAPNAECSDRRRPDRKTHPFDPGHHLLRIPRAFHSAKCRVPNTIASKTQSQLKITWKITWNTSQHNIFIRTLTLIATLAQLQCYHFIRHVDVCLYAQRLAKNPTKSTIQLSNTVTKSILSWNWPLILCCFFFVVSNRCTMIVCVRSFVLNFFTFESQFSYVWQFTP